MRVGFESGVIASFLGSGRVLAGASHCAALIGAGGTLFARSAVAPLILAVPVLCWPAACYFGLRVTIDAALFDRLALEEEGSGEALDAMLRSCGLRKETPARSFSDRRQGALRLWKRQAAIVGIQIAAVVAGIFFEVLGK